MDLVLILVIYLILLVVIIFALFKSGIKIWSSIILGLVICQIILNILKPPSSIDLDEESGSNYAFYILIQIFTPIIVYIYVIVMTANDKIDKVCYMKEKQVTCSTGPAIDIDKYLSVF